MKEFFSSCGRILPRAMVYEAAKTTDNWVVETVSQGNILPSSATPDHLRIFKLSVLDQIALNVYIPLILFYHNNNTSHLSSVISNRSKLLKHALSKTLSQFYPFAGKVKDNLHIECNDQGVHYIETQVNTHLSDFLGQSPGNEMLNLLVPQNAKESAIGNYVLMIQVNVFACGGVAICTCINHKFVDGDTYSLFLRHWATAARGSVHTINPSFTAPSLFPQISSLNFHNPESIGKAKFVSQRFVFDRTNLAALKSKTSSPTSESAPTRFEVVAALLWKCFAKAANTVNNNFLEKSLILAMVINLRGKNCVPKNAVGNLIWHGFAECKLSANLEHHFLASQIQKGKAQVNDDFIEVIKGESGATTILKYAEMIMKSEEVSVPVVITSMCNMGIYEHDFGEGKPIWFYYGNLSLVNFISLCETRVGGGLEAVVSLRKEEMVIFENDPELLAFASLSPAPI
ncbi:Transferase, Chloramphenicol acetyltransferase-like domain protein [Heracleum sosnowskyi]|uniref:Transferase, Chloramphenicol acetyltransferase-like domain protein n=1 Tax=Heracleum sosnowskyi TaxID=360622 RepID=A0AAD8N4T2_9APIA|nr:Transferase, Chloramphenicol acetyltransferase-like domain protein [Heracleum sosnowskyi]